MDKVVQVHIPENVINTLNRTPDELGRDMRLYAALMLFRLGKLSSGLAAEMAGIPRVMFLDLCSEYGIPISQISPQELAQEIEVDE